MSSTVENSFAVVTGSANGIGLAIAKRFVEDGAAGVAIVDLSKEAAEKACRELEGISNTNLIAVACDVSVKGEVSNAFEEIYTSFGRIDILINNAGITRDIMFHKMEEDQWTQVLNVHLNGMFFCTKAVINSMRNQGYGRIVNMSSTSAYGMAGQTNYCTAKAGMIGFTKALAKENANKGITVNSIAPGWIVTDMIKSVVGVDEMLAQTPMRRGGTPEEVAALVSFLCSRDSSYITGEWIRASGACLTGN